MDKFIDLHTHSYISDGSSSPTEIIKAAYKNNLKAISLTDHDSIDGIKEASAVSKKYNIEFLTGIEINSLYNHKRILHIIGLGIDINNKYFLNSCTNNEIRQIIEVLKLLIDYTLIS